MSDPPIIALATFKGGSGKSTLAACLATHWRREGRSPAIVDADPQHSVSQWLGAAGPVSLKIVAAQPLGLPSTLAALKPDHCPILIDTAGFRHRLSAAAIASADLVLIPVKPSPLDVRIALQTFALVNAGEGRAKAGAAPTLVRFVLTMTTPGSVIARHVRRRMEASRLPLLASEMCNRVSYAEAALIGATPTVTEPAGPAAREVARLAREIEAFYPSAFAGLGGRHAQDVV